jgi:hypothetical protein
MFVVKKATAPRYRFAAWFGVRGKRNRFAVSLRGMFVVKKATAPRYGFAAWLAVRGKKVKPLRGIASRLNAMFVVVLFVWVVMARSAHCGAPRLFVP